MALSTVGTMLLISDSGDYSTVACVTALAGPASSVTMLDSTCLESETVTRIAGIIDSGEVTITINWDPDAATHEDLRDLLVGRASEDFAIIWPAYGVTDVAFTVDTGTDIATAGAAHGMITGQSVQFSSTTTLPSPLAESTTYFVNAINATTFTVHTTNAAAVAGTGDIDFTDTGTGTHSVELPDRWDFTAFVSAMSPAATVNDILTASVTLSITDSIT
jgi:hypothetical protein